MHPLTVRRHAQALHAAGVPLRDVVARVGLPRNTVKDWLYGERGRASRRTTERPTRCPFHGGPGLLELDRMAYAYLLGLYLGDGHLLMTQRVPLLRVFCATEYPGIIAECRAAMTATLARTVGVMPKVGCVSVQSYGRHWPCLLPQHGPGMKHQRRILLADWQEEIVREHPGPLARGLFHSDGCRVTNRVTVRGKGYEYPRYFFNNESADILGICGDALDRLGCAWRFNRRDSISVARAQSVAILDVHVGPKT